jgi:hypothetical protein
LDESPDNVQMIATLELILPQAFEQRPGAATTEDASLLDAINHRMDRFESMLHANAGASTSAMAAACANPDNGAAVTQSPSLFVCSPMPNPLIPNPNPNPRQQGYGVASTATNRLAASTDTSWGRGGAKCEENMLPASFPELHSQDNEILACIHPGSETLSQVTRGLLGTQESLPHLSQLPGSQTFSQMFDRDNSEALLGEAWTTAVTGEASLADAELGS